MSSLLHIIGPGCGGTSLLAGLLDSNSSIDVGFELFAMKYLYQNNYKFLGPFSWRYRLHLYRHSICRLSEQVSQPYFINKITTEQLAGLLDSNYSHDSQRNKSRLSISTRYLFQSQKLILLMRDGRTCIPSKIKRGNHSLLSSTLRWRQSAHIIKYLHNSSLPTFLLTYEALVSNTTHCLQDLCDFIGVQYSPDMLEGSTNSKMHPRYHSPVISLPSLPDPLPSSVISDISPELELFGYL